MDIIGADFVDRPQRQTHSVRCKLQAGTTYTEQHNQVIGIMYRNIWNIYGPDVPVHNELPSSNERYHRRLRRIIGLKFCETSRSRWSDRYQPDILG